jgi:SAM-dependent methyltransferase
MGWQTGDQRQLFYLFNLERRIPASHLLPRINPIVMQVLADLREMRKAHERVAEHKLAHVEALAVMDAQHLGFPDAFFDAVVAQYVITTVPNPEAALDEFARVTKAAGEIIMVNHLGAEAGPRRVFEQSFAPVARRLGWRPEFRWQRLARWAERHGGVRLLERRAMPPLGHFSLIHFERLAGANGRGRGGDGQRSIGSSACGFVDVDEQVSASHWRS